MKAIILKKTEPDEMYAVTELEEQKLSLCFIKKSQKQIFRHHDKNFTVGETFLKTFFLLVKRSRPLLKRDLSINKPCKPNPINCNQLLNNLWIKKTKKINHTLSTFYLLTYAEIFKYIPKQPIWILNTQELIKTRPDHL